MSRGVMTAWICGTLLLLGFGGLYFATRMDPMERNAECQTTFGMDQDCVLANASRRLRGGYDPLASEALAEPSDFEVREGYAEMMEPYE